MPRDARCVVVSKWMGRVFGDIWFGSSRVQGGGIHCESPTMIEHLYTRDLYDMNRLGPVVQALWCGLIRTKNIYFDITFSWQKQNILVLQGFRTPQIFLATE